MVMIDALVGFLKLNLETNYYQIMRQNETAVTVTNIIVVVS